MPRPIWFSREEIAQLWAYNPHGAVDNSITLKYVLTPFYEFVTSFIPLCVAPNVVTVTGTAAVALVHCLIAYFSPDLSTNEVPGWLCFLAGCAIFAYQTLDNCDGKQARRTKAGSPLGHLFDHGCDAIACTIVAVILIAILRMGFTQKALLTMLSFGSLQAMFATWEEYYTERMVLGKINGPIEGLLLLELLCFFTAWKGFAPWTTRICDVVPLSPPSCVFGEVTMVDFVLFAVGGAALYVFCGNVWNVYVWSRRERASFARAALDLSPALFMFFSALFVMSNSPSSIGHNHGFLYFWSCGLSFAYLISKMMINHLSAQYFNYQNPIVLPWIALTANTVSALVSPTNTPYLPEHPLLFASFVFILTIYASQIIGAVTDFRTQLGIPCFSIPKHRRLRRD